MKMAMTALAVVFLAGAAPAMAAPGDEDRPSRAEMAHDRPHSDGDNGRRAWTERRETREAPQAVQAPRAPEAPRSAEPRVRSDERVRVPGDSVGRPGPWVRGGEGQTVTERSRGPAVAQRRDDVRRDGDRRNWDRRDGTRDGTSDGNLRYGDRRDGTRDGDRRDWDRRDGTRDGNLRYGDRRDGDRRYDRDRRDDRTRWERGRYPSVYFSSHRYRHSWRPPAGYYVRLWSFGDFLPRGWYDQEYFISDPWDFDLPLAPPGYDWVRVGEDALLIDRFTGRIVQVVRDVFW